MKKLGLFISILIIMLLFGCGEEKPEFSEHITPVLEIMANAPNADYLDPESMLSYGLNSEPSEAEREEAARLTQINDENWEKALGEHFGPGCLRAFINTGIGKNLLWTVEATDVESIELKSIDLKETKQNGDEIVSVTVTVDGEKEVVFEMKFSYDKDGLIDGVWYEPEGMNIVEVIRGEGMLFEEKTYKPEEELYGLPAVKLPMLDGKELLEVWKNADRKYGHPVIILNDRLVEEMLEDGEYEEGELPDIDEYLSEYIEELEESEYKEDIMGSPEDTGDPLTKFLTPFMSEEERWLVWVPVAEPWLIFEKLPIGGWNECPDANHMAAFSKKVNTISGAVPALISGATLEYYTPRRLNDDEALPMALDMYGFCSDIDGVYALADALLKSDIWYFWWD